VAAFEAYFDESERKGRVFCVAGYAFLPRQARRFTKEWEPLFKPYGGFHMTDLLARKNGYEAIKEGQKDRLLKEAVRIVNMRMQFGVAVSCPVDQITLHSQSVKAFSHAYPICCYLAMVNLVALIEESGCRREVKYVFEDGHFMEGTAREFINAVVSRPEIKRDLAHAGDAFLPKRDAVPLQAADLFAWEWAKCQDETIDQELRPLRKSLKALFMRETKRYKVAHVHGEKLMKWLQVMPQLLRQEGIIDEAGNTRRVQ
jgi:hypothetical protein